MARISIEDCQEKMPNRFALVIVAASRVRQLMDNSEPLIKTKNKEAVTALREVAEGVIVRKGEFGIMDEEVTDF
jgi:DNA-directed RNA polymerase subunit omega